MKKKERKKKVLKKERKKEKMMQNVVQKVKKAKKAKKLYNDESYKDEGVMTMTFSECVENQIGMEQIGEKCEVGFSHEDLLSAKSYFEKMGCVCELVCLNDLIEEDEELEKAYVLIMRNGVDSIYASEGMEVTKEGLYNVLKMLKWDDKYWDTRRKRVLNKNARVNMCVSNFSQEADYEAKKGTVYDFKDLNLLNLIRKNLNKVGKSFENMNAEGNWYYNLENCGIGFHGDVERKKVLGVRLGMKSMNLCFKWFQNSKSFGEMFETILNPGDMYIMSDKAGGSDWKRRSVKSLRHCCGGVKWMKKVMKSMK